RHPVPMQSAVEPAEPLAANPPLPAWQIPVDWHSELDVACTVSAPTAEERLDARVAQPASVPLSQSARTDAEVAASRSLSSTPGAVAIEETVAVMFAWHTVVPSQRVEPVAVLWERCPSGPATAPASPDAAPVQPISGQRISELACPLPEETGTGFSPDSPSWERSVTAVTSL